MPILIPGSNLAKLLAKIYGLLLFLFLAWVGLSLLTSCLKTWSDGCGSPWGVERYGVDTDLWCKR